MIPMSEWWQKEFVGSEGSSDPEDEKNSSEFFEFRVGHQSQEDKKTLIKQWPKKEIPNQPCFSGGCIRFFGGAKKRYRTCASSTFRACEGLRSRRASMTRVLRMLWSRSVS